MWEAIPNQYNEYEIYYDQELMWHVHFTDFDLFIENFKPNVVIYLSSDEPLL